MQMNKKILCQNLVLILFSLHLAEDVRLDFTKKMLKPYSTNKEIGFSYILVFIIIIYVHNFALARFVFGHWIFVLKGKVGLNLHMPKLFSSPFANK